MAGPHTALRSRNALLYTHLPEAHILSVLVMRFRRGAGMECGSQDLLCEVTNWLSQNDLLAPWLVEVIGKFGVQANGLAGQLAQLVRDYGQTMVGLVGVTFGFWRWWRYREHILHKRLEEYLSENDQRLMQGTREVIELIQRPAPGQQLKDPLFVDADLRVVLRERNWDKPAYALGIAASSDWHLDKAIDAINRRLATAQAMVASLNRQVFSAHSIRGAIASSLGHREDTKSSSNALDQFKTALAVPGHGRDISIRELEAHQMRKLGLAGRDVYNDVLALAIGMDDQRKRAYQTARMKRYVAEMTVKLRPRNAYWMLTEPEEALPLLARCEPLSLWEKLEKADVQYLAAYCARLSPYPVREAMHLADAGATYANLVRDLSARRWLRPRRYRRLRIKAREGLNRVRDAQNGSYDTSWLPPT